MKKFIVVIVAFLIAWPWASVQAMPLAGRIVAIDAGHGGWDPGKQVDTIPDEKDINLAIAELLQMYLELGGASAFLTRADDTALANRKTPDLEARARLITDVRADIFISIHQNAYSSASVKGPQVFYYEGSEKSGALAGAIQKNLEDFLALEKHREAKADKNYFLLSKTIGPAVIVECGFLTNPEDAAALCRHDYQQKVSWGIYLGIIEYFTNNELE